MKVISTINFKGGVGKTTVTWLLAKMASDEGKRVLVVDTDAQMSLTTALTVDKDRGTFIGNFEDWYDNQHRAHSRTLLDALDVYDRFAKGALTQFDFPINRSFIYTVSPTLDFIPSSSELYWMELEVFLPQNVKGFINALVGRIAHVRNYDLIFFDCPPSFTLLSYSVLSNCSMILVPVNPDVFASRGLGMMVEGIHNRIQPWPQPSIAVFMNRAGGRFSRGVFSPYNETHNFYQEVVREANRITSQLTPVRVLNTLIPERAGIRKAISFGGFPSEFNADFNNLWSEIKLILSI